MRNRVGPVLTPALVSYVGPVQQLTIRKAIPGDGADSATVLAFHRQLYLDHRRSVAVPSADPECSHGELEAALADNVRGLLSSKACLVLLATRENHAIGYITGKVIEGRPCSRGVVEDWYVVPEARQAGVGSKLMRALLERFADEGCAIAESTTMAANDDARQAHISAGFAEAEIRYRMRLD